MRLEHFITQKARCQEKYKFLFFIFKFIYLGNIGDGSVCYDTSLEIASGETYKLTTISENVIVE